MSRENKLEMNMGSHYIECCVVTYVYERNVLEGRLTTIIWDGFAWSFSLL